MSDPDNVLRPLGPEWAAIVLAAGEGRRMGGRPKCLLQLDGVPLISHQLNLLFELGVGQIVLVLGHHASAIKEAVADYTSDPRLSVVEQQGNTHSQQDSLKLGLAQLSPSIQTVISSPADLPSLRRDEYEFVVRAYQTRAPDCHFVGPVVNDVPGHPVIFDRTVVDQVLSGQGPFGSGRWRGAALPGVCHCVSDNDRFIEDLDTEADRLAIAERRGVSLDWDDF